MLLFPAPKPILGMLHLGGSDRDARLARALSEARIMVDGGIDGLIVENYFGDAEDVVRCLGRIFEVVRDRPIGVNVLGDTDMAFDLASRFPIAFLQIDTVSGHLPPELDGRYEDALASARNACSASILGGVRFKYQPVLSGRSEVEDVILGSTRCDAIVITSDATGQETDLDKVSRFRAAVGPDYPLLIGAGMTADNVHEQLRLADGGIVGSWIKDGHRDVGPVSARNVQRFMDAVQAVRNETPRPPETT